MSVLLERHPWRLELMDGTVVTEEAHTFTNLSQLWERPDIKVFSFRTPAGEIGVNHATGMFFALGHILHHPDHRHAGYRHWHRVGRATDLGSLTKPQVTGYSVGMETKRPDGSRQILFLWFPPSVQLLTEVRVRTRYVYAGDGRKDQDIDFPLSMWVQARSPRGSVA